MSARRYRRPVLLLFAVALLCAQAIACGPDFPAQLLDDRAGTLRGTPANSFEYEVRHLVRAGDKLRAEETGPDDDAGPHIPDYADKSLTGDQRALLARMRLHEDGDDAFRLGGGLPVALRLYTAGALDYRLALKWNNAVLTERARQRFRAVLELPSSDGAPRAVWAAYMLAIMQARHVPGADSGAAENGRSAALWRDNAVQGFADVRARALAGDDDSEGLAVASYGEEASLYLRGVDNDCDYAALADRKPVCDGIAPQDAKHAIYLYAEQAARGSASAVQSLRALAEWGLAGAARTRTLINDPVAARLLVAYGLARLGDIGDASTDNVFGGPTCIQSGLVDAALGNPHIKPNPRLVALVDGLCSLDSVQVAGADRIAALAYRIGRYDLAMRLAERMSTPLAWWVRAKVAVRKGDDDLAAQAYMHAIQAFARNDGSLDAASQSLLQGEEGVFSLSRGQYVQALDQFYRAGMRQQSQSQEGSTPDTEVAAGDYWNDLAYVAERVLSTDELRTYVDANVPAPPPQKIDATHMDATAMEEWQARHPVTLSDKLRRLLARRLMRDGARAQAIAYFPANDDARFADIDDTGASPVMTPQNLRERAVDYDAALSEGHDGWRAITRARALYRAAMLARNQGMELLGYEQDPDYGVYGGSFDGGAGRAGNDFSGDSSVQPDTPEKRALRDLPGPYVTGEERRRFAASEARPYRRFHYREIAADHAVAAAGLLPARSQAFAATLRQAAGYVLRDDPQRARALYRRYVREGAAVSFASNFGRNCPQPDFNRAAHFRFDQILRRLWHHRIYAALATTMTLVAFSGGIWLQQRRGRRP